MRVSKDFDVTKKVLSKGMNKDSKGQNVEGFLCDIHDKVQQNEFLNQTINARDF